MTTDQLAAMVRDADGLMTAYRNGLSTLGIYAADCERHVKALVAEVERLQGEVTRLRKAVCPGCRDNVPLEGEWTHKHTSRSFTLCEAMP